MIHGIFSCLRPRFKILAYHSVNSISKNPYEVNEKDFLMQMQYLAKEGYTALSLEDAVGTMSMGRINKKSLVITFDDGFACISDVAFPILKDLGFPATVFIPFGYLGGIDSFSYEHPRPDMPILNWNAVEESLKIGISYGSHTITHRNLVNLADSEITTEVAESKNLLYHRIGTRFFALAYPYGMYNERVKRIVRNNGYDCALCFGNILSNTKNSDLFELKREKILNNTSINSFRKLVDVKYDFNRKLLDLTGKYKSN